MNIRTNLKNFGFLFVTLLFVTLTGCAETKNIADWVMKEVLHISENNLLFVLAEDAEKFKYDIYSLDPDNLTSRKILGDALNPVWSPDGQKIAFTSISEKGQVMNLSVADKDGKDIKKITNYQKEFSEILDVSWSGDGKKIALARNNQIVVAGLAGNPEVVYTGDKQVVQVDWLKDGERLVIWDPPKGILLINLRTKKTDLILPFKNAFPKVLPGTNKIIFIRRDDKYNYDLMQKDMDGGQEEILVKDVAVLSLKNNFTISGNGRKIFFNQKPEKDKDAWQVGSFDTASQSVSYHKNVKGLVGAVSYDGNKVAGIFSAQEKKAGYEIMDLKSGQSVLIKEIDLTSSQKGFSRTVIMMTKLMDW